MAAADPKTENTYLVDVLSRPLLTGWFRTVYDNPWETWRSILLNYHLLKFPFVRRLFDIPSDEEELNKHLPVLDYEKDKQKIKFEAADTLNDSIKFMWIGHASCLVKMNGCTFLADPIFSEHCQPNLYFNILKFKSAKRYRPVPCGIDDLPHIDAVVISHNHYDHLDLDTVLALHRRFSTNLKWFVPKGIKRWFTSTCGNSVNCEELDWWETSIFKDKLQFGLTPSQHWCGRFPPFDYNTSLWGSWCVKTVNKNPPLNFFFGGDTGYCSAFKEIGKQYGPFDLAAIPIGAYYPRECLRSQHVDPKEAFQIHCDIQSKESIGIHWGTFRLGREGYLSPRRELYTSRQEFIEKGGEKKNALFYVIKHGEVITSGRPDMYERIDEDSYIRVTKTNILIHKE